LEVKFLPKRPDCTILYTNGLVLYEGGDCETYGVLKVSRNRGDKPLPHVQIISFY